MSDQEWPRSGAGRGEGAESGPVEPSADEPSAEEASDESTGDIEIPIGMPMSTAEIARLKAAAERHRHRAESDPPAQADDSAPEEEGDGP